MFYTPLFGQTNYFEYHESINQAEEYFSNEQFDEAIVVYDKVFQKYDYVYVKDYLIAAQIAILINSEETAFRYLEEAMKSGYTSESMEKFPLFHELINTEEWNILKSKEDKFRKEYLSKIDFDLLVEFSERYRNEQDTKSAKDQSEYKTNVISNFNRIKFLMDSFYFPSEKRIGLDNSRIAPNKRNKTSGLSDYSAGNSKVIPTLLHYDNPITEIGIDKFIESIELGDLHPRQFAQIFTFEKNYMSRINDDKNINKPDLPDYTFNFPFGVNSDNVEKVNLDRKKIGICSVEIDRKKRSVAKKYKLRVKFGYK